MNDKQRFTEAMQGHEIGVHPRTGEVLHFEPWIAECDVCGAQDMAGDQVEYPAGDTTIRLCPECR